MSQNLNREFLIKLPYLKDEYFGYYYLKKNTNGSQFFSDRYNLFELLSIWSSHIGIKISMKTQLTIAEKFRKEFKSEKNDLRINKQFFIDCDEFPRFVDNVLLPILEESQKNPKKDNITILSMY